MKQAELIPSISSEDWQKKKFYFPKNTINVATLFSGIGAIEHALKRLKLKSNIVIHVLPLGRKMDSSSSTFSSLPFRA